MQTGKKIERFPYKINPSTYILSSTSKRTRHVGKLHCANPSSLGYHGQGYSTCARVLFFNAKLTSDMQASSLPNNPRSGADDGWPQGAMG